jgi:hypothetical protein
MMMTSSVLTLAALVLGADPAQPNPLAGISAVYFEDQLFVVHPGTPPVSTRATVEVKPEYSKWPETRVHYGPWHDEKPRGGVRKILVAHDRLWCVGPGSREYSVTPLDDLDLFEFSTWAHKRLKKKCDRYGGPFAYMSHDLFGLRVRGFYEMQETSKQLEALGWTPQTPLGEFNKPSLAALYYDEISEKTPYDIIPTGEGTVTFVYSTQYMLKVGGHDLDGEIAFQEMKIGKSLGGIGKGVTEPVADSKPVSVDVRVFGDFWAYQIDGVYYLQTHAGKLFAVTKGKKGKLESQTLWDDAKRPLIGAIQDVNKNKVYAFGRDGKEGKRFALELSLKPKPVEYETKAKPDDGFQEAKDALLTMHK